MADAGAPLGNKNAAKAKQWTAAIERALERRGDSSIDPDHPLERSPKAKALDALAESFIAKMEADQDIGFFREFGDRLEGKAPQSTVIENPDGTNLFTGITVTFVKPAG